MRFLSYLGLFYYNYPQSQGGKTLFDRVKISAFGPKRFYPNDIIDLGLA